MKRTMSLSLGMLTNKTTTALKGRGVLTVNASWSLDYGAAKISTSLDAATALDMARSLPHFRPSYAEKRANGSSVVYGKIVISK